VLSGSTARARASCRPESPGRLRFASASYACPPAYRLLSIERPATRTRRYALPMTDPRIQESAELAVALMTAWNGGDRQGTLDRLMPSVSDWLRGDGSLEERRGRQVFLFTSQANLAHYMAVKLSAATGESLDAIFAEAGRQVAADQ